MLYPTHWSSYHLCPFLLTPPVSCSPRSLFLSQLLSSLAPAPKMANLRLVCPLSRSLTTPLSRTLYTSARPTSPSSSSSARPLPSYTLFNYTLAFSLPFSFWGLFGGGGANSAGKSSASSGVDVVSKSSTVFREQNAFVGRQQASTLMFASVRGEGRKE